MRLLAGVLAAALVLAHAALPMRMVTPAGFSELVICSAQGVKTILVDRDMNRAAPEKARGHGVQHCGLCTLAFGLFLAIALTIGLAAPAIIIASRCIDQWRPQRHAFRLACPRAPPLPA